MLIRRFLERCGFVSVRKLCEESCRHHGYETREVSVVVGEETFSHGVLVVEFDRDCMETCGFPFGSRRFHKVRRELDSLFNGHCIRLPFGLTVLRVKGVD